MNSLGTREGVVGGRGRGVDLEAGGKGGETGEGEEGDGGARGGNGGKSESNLKAGGFALGKAVDPIACARGGRGVVGVLLVDISSYVADTWDTVGDVGCVGTNCPRRGALPLKVWRHEACYQPSPTGADGGGA